MRHDVVEVLVVFRILARTDDNLASLVGIEAIDIVDILGIYLTTRHLKLLDLGHKPRNT